MFSLVECTSLITRIAARVVALQGNVVLYIQPERIHLNEFFFIHGHILKDARDQSLVFFFRDYANEILLPNSGLHLYKSRALTFHHQPRQQARRSSVSWRETQSRSRVEADTPQQTAIKNRSGHIILAATLPADSTIDVPGGTSSSWTDARANPHVLSRLGVN
jgi:hypothetical protein